MSDALKAAARNYMIRNVGDCRDAKTNEVNTTQLAENAAHELDHDEWLDNETHWIWDLAFEIGEKTEKMWSLLASKQGK